MKVLLAGPTETSALRLSLGLELKGAPPADVQTPLALLTAGLRALGHDVHLLTLDSTIATPVTFTEDGISITFCPFREAPQYRARVRALDLFEAEIRYLEAAIRDIKPDIVHAHWTYEYAEAAIRSGCPHIVTMHDLGWECFWQFRDVYRFMRLMMKYRTMPRIRNLTVVAPFMARKARYYGYFGPVTVIPNAVEIPDMAPDAITRRSLDKPCVVTIGNSSRLKNVRKSVEAFRFVKRQLPQAELHLFGPGLDVGYAVGEPGVVAHGSVRHSELMDFLYDEATLLIHPSRLETFGVIITEAKAHAVPVVGGRNSGGVAYVCGENAGCLLVDVNDARAIADATLRLIQDSQSYFQNAIRGYEDVRDRFSVRKVSLAYTAAYQGVLGPVDKAQPDFG